MSGHGVTSHSIDCVERRRSITRSSTEAGLNRDFLGELHSHAKRVTDGSQDGLGSAVDQVLLYRSGIRTVYLQLYPV